MTRIKFRYVFFAILAFTLGVSWLFVNLGSFDPNPVCPTCGQEIHPKRFHP